MSIMAVTSRLIILALLLFNALPTAASLAEPHLTSTAISFFQNFIISRALSTATAPRSAFLPDEVTQRLSMQGINVSSLGKRGWTKEQYSVFLGWMIPFGVFVAAALLYIFFGAKIHAAWRKCWEWREDVEATAI
jgi:hypothetical protein